VRLAGRGILGELFMSSVQIRNELVEALKLDLVGPANNHAFAHELLSDAPSRWYLSGFLVPSEAPADQKTDETSNEEIDSGGDTGGTDDDTEPDRAAARKSILPSSMGLSVLVAPGVETLKATVKGSVPEFGTHSYRHPSTIAFIGLLHSTSQPLQFPTVRKRGVARFCGGPGTKRPVPSRSPAPNRLGNQAHSRCGSEAGASGHCLPERRIHAAVCGIPPSLATPCYLYAAGHSMVSGLGMLDAYLACPRR